VFHPWLFLFALLWLRLCGFLFLSYFVFFHVRTSRTDLSAHSAVNGFLESFLASGAA
jgi:hypothetical protein